MKSFIVTAILALSLNTFALDANSTWEEILASKKTDARLPQISFSAGEVTSFLSVEKLCYTASQIKTIEAQNVYNQVVVGKDKINLVVVGKEVLSTSRIYTKMISDGSDHGLTPITVSIPLAYNISVYAVSSSDHQSNRVLFNKVLALPACQ